MKGIRHDDFVAHVCDLFAPLGAVRPRAMFGGYGIYVDELFCAIIARDTLYLKADDSNRADFEARGCQRFVPFADQRMVLSYYEVPAEVMDDREAFAVWGARALAAARGTAARRGTGTRKARSLAPPRRPPRKRVRE